MSEATLLAVDTCFGALSAAVLASETVLAQQWQAMERGHAEALAPMVEAVMAEAGLGFAALDKLAVTTGPGSFTGQRVGLAFMRGLRVALQKPLIGVTSLAAMAAEAMSETGLAQGAAVHDAKRGEVYLETTVHSARILPFGDAAELLAALGPLALAGTAAPRLGALCPQARVTAITAPNAVFVAKLAAGMEARGVPHPLYLRPPDAKLPGGKTPVFS